MVVGWYHSHPGFGCWLSGVDINTQQSFEALNQRAVAVVVDPVQSVKGKVVIDAFRLISPQVWCGVGSDCWPPPVWSIQAVSPRGGRMWGLLGGHCATTMPVQQHTLLFLATPHAFALPCHGPSSCCPPRPPPCLLA